MCVRVYLPLYLLAQIVLRHKTRSNKVAFGTKNAPLFLRLVIMCFWICVQSLLLDVHIPEMRDVQFLEAHQSWRKTQAQPTMVMLLTTSVDSQDLLRIDELQIDELVSKPLTE